MKIHFLLFQGFSLLMSKGDNLALGYCPSSAVIFDTSGPKFYYYFMFTKYIFLWNNMKLG